MKTLPLSQISVLDRVRSHVKQKELSELKASIAGKGLMHPIVLRQSPTGTFHLVAGERRLRAIQELNLENKIFSCDGSVVEPGHVPYILLTDLSEVQYGEAELEENLRRVDLSWQEVNDAYLKLHGLRTEANPNQSKLETGKEIAAARETNPRTESARLGRAQIIARHMEDPDVQAAVSERSAYTLALRKDAAAFQAELARREVSTRIASSSHQLVEGNLADVEWPVETYRVIIADPPYGIDAGGFGSASRLRHSYDDTRGAALTLAECILRKGFDAALARAHLYLFCDIETFLELRSLAADAGWEPWRTPLIWNKGHTAHAPLADRGFRREHELILFCRKGGHVLNQLTSDILDYPTTGEREHAAQKPLALYAALIRASAVAGDRVLDPCCGSGTIFPAAFATSTRATGIEQDPAAHTIALARMNKILNNPQPQEEENGTPGVLGQEKFE